ncbi:MAG: MerR family transcriptional regulator [Thiobacillus sp.]|nr:MerR family transcriptional regulator [Thiobacillus sp.]
MDAKSMSRAEVAKRTGCNLETVRYYEKTGLMPAPPRSEAGYRQYDEEHVRRLHFVMRGRELGFSINELKALLDLVDRKAVTCSEAERVGKAHLTAVRRKIKDLKRMESVLSQMLKHCSGKDVPDCPMIDALFGAA